MISTFSLTVEQELLTLPQRLISSPFLVGFVLLDLWFCMHVLLIVFCPFVLFLLVIVLSVFLPYTDSDYPFGIFKLFFHLFTDNVRHKAMTIDRVGSNQLISALFDYFRLLRLLLEIMAHLKRCSTKKDGKRPRTWVKSPQYYLLRNSRILN